MNKPQDIDSSEKISPLVDLLPASRAMKSARKPAGDDAAG
jgi:hypothetical protein